MSHRIWLFHMRIARKKVIATNNRAPEPLAVCAEQIGIALSLFRAAALDMTSQEAILPLSDRAIEMALLEPDALERGIGVVDTSNRKPPLRI
jgi:hypothetical protein